MELLFYGDGKTNFGDDLNAVLWRHVLPAWVFELPDVALLGIGTIFTDRWVGSPKISGKRLFVIGSGAGYWPLPPNVNEWNILALRGPLSAALIERPELAATDAAALLSLAPGLCTMKEERERDQVLFIPHLGSLKRAHWPEVAKEAGVVFIDPQWPLEVILNYFSRAKLVLAEAMHGAIVADTLRIPWIPWTSHSGDVVPFKWVDWTMSLNTVYRPVDVPSTSTWTRWRTRLRDSGRRERSQNGHGTELAPPDPNLYLADFHARFGKRVEEVPKSAEWRESAMRRTALKLYELSDRKSIGPAVKAVRGMLTQRPFLSEDSIFQRRTEQLQRALQQFERAVQ
jgi:succinoglycan biosynthesis protein ExoV